MKPAFCSLNKPVLGIIHCMWGMWAPCFGGVLSGSRLYERFKSIKSGVHTTDFTVLHSCKRAILIWKSRMIKQAWNPGKTSTGIQEHYPDRGVSKRVSEWVDRGKMYKLPFHLKPTHFFVNNNLSFRNIHITYVYSFLVGLK